MGKLKPKLLIGDAVAVMRRMPDASVDAIVTDPPYGLEFMGKDWDGADGFRRSLNPNDAGRDSAFGRMSRKAPEYRAGVAFQEFSEAWARECHRVLKPGGHLLAFGGTRTWHRLAVAVEDAGFEIRDSIAWMYGSGFPKSLDVSKAIDKLDAADERRTRNLSFTAWMRSTGITSARINELTGTNMGGHYLTNAAQPAVATADLFDLLRPELPDVPAFIEALVLERTVESQNFKTRAVVGERTTGISTGRGTVAFIGDSDNRDITAPATDDARQWQGWGTALKPAHEPIIVARKPLQGTVAANVLRHGTGALNIDGCRIAGDVPRTGQGVSANQGTIYNDGINKPGVREFVPNPGGRWPANVTLDDDQAAALDEQSGNLKSGALKPYKERHKNASSYSFDREKNYVKAPDQGGASRFFYVAKAPKNERPFYFRQSCACKEAKPCEEISRPRDTGESRSETGASWSTSTSGSSITGEQSRPDTTSTTGTATSSTTTSATSSSSPNLSTSAFTPGASSAMGFGGSPAESAASSSQSVPTTGTSAGRGGRSTDDAAPATSSKWSETSVCGSCGARAKRESHATVKPLSLMRWLVRLVTPAGGTVLDPFAGSGTTGEAAILEGFRVTLIEREREYVPLIMARLARAQGSAS